MLKDTSTKLNNVISGKKIFETVTTIEELHTFSLDELLTLKRLINYVIEEKRNETK